jgi:DNA repair protein RadA/Sms
MPKTKAVYRCTACRCEVPKWVGKCPDCGEWGTVAEGPVPAAAGRGGLTLPSTPALPIGRVDAKATRHKPTGVSELDRVLGGGLVPGSVVLLSGEPGVGKSTLLLEVVRRWAVRSADDRALYVTGEESAGQVRLRADRTGAVVDDLFLAAESDLSTVLGHIDQVSPTLLVIDSVQTMQATGTEGTVGGVAQVRAVTAALTSLAKSSGIAVLLIGHVTKDGAVAGPRTLEHLVDVVLHFEGDRHTTLRTIRGLKNRFGTADEVGCFELQEDGIRCITDPSGIFLHERADIVAGTTVTVAMDGKRPLVGEVQALTNHSQIPIPRRAVSGLDFNRVAMVLAVLTRRCRVSLTEHEVYASTVGGMRVVEPAADLAIALAIASAARNRPIPSHVVAIGEVGLTGEVRPVSGLARRLAEAQRLGFRTAIVPASTAELSVRGMRLITVGRLEDALLEYKLIPPPPEKRTREGAARLHPVDG